ISDGATPGPGVAAGHGASWVPPSASPTWGDAGIKLTVVPALVSCGQWSSDCAKQANVSRLATPERGAAHAPADRSPPVRIPPLPPRLPLGGPDVTTIVHDYLTQRGGAERVVLTLAQALEAPLVTSLFGPRATYPEFRDLQVRTAWFNR